MLHEGLGVVLHEGLGAVLHEGLGAVLYLEGQDGEGDTGLSPYISLHLPTSPYISLYLEGQDGEGLLDLHGDVWLA